MDDFEVDTKLEQIPNRYALCMALAKRAKDLNNGSRPLTVEADSKKPAKTALEELASGKISIFDRSKD